VTKTKFVNTYLPPATGNISEKRDNIKIYEDVVLFSGIV
jgi:hypothetical protein